MFQNEQEEGEDEGGAKKDVSEDKLPGSGSDESDDDDSEVRLEWPSHLGYVPADMNGFPFQMTAQNFRIYLNFCSVHTGILFFILQTKLLYHLCLQRKKTGVEGLIEIENPNRVAQKSKKVTQIELDEPRQLSRRERFVSANIQQELWFSFACKAIRYKIILQLCSNSSNWNSSCSKVKYY